MQGYSENTEHLMLVYPIFFNYILYIKIDTHKGLSLSLSLSTIYFSYRQLKCILINHQNFKMLVLLLFKTTNQSQISLAKKDIL